MLKLPEAKHKLIACPNILKFVFFQYKVNPFISSFSVVHFGFMH